MANKHRLYIQGLKEIEEERKRLAGGGAKPSYSPIYPFGERPGTEKPKPVVQPPKQPGLGQKFIDFIKGMVTPEPAPVKPEVLPPPGGGIDVRTGQRIPVVPKPPAEAIPTVKPEIPQMVDVRTGGVYTGPAFIPAPEPTKRKPIMALNVREELERQKLQEKYNKVFEHPILGFLAGNNLLPDDWENYVKSGWGSLKSAEGALLAYLGDKLKSETLKKIGEKDILVGQEIQRAYPTREAHTKLEEMIGDTLQSAPTTIATMIPAMAGFALGGPIVGAGISTLLDAAQEAGGVYADAKARGLSDKDAEKAFNQVYLKNLPLALQNIPEWIIAMTPAGKVVPKGLQKYLGKGFSKAASAGLKLGLGALAEGAEEMYQTAVQMQALGDDTRSIAKQMLDPSEEMKRAGRAGIFMGALFGGGAHVLSQIGERAQAKMNDVQKAAFMQEVQQLVQAGTPEEQAEQVAMDRFAETPEGQNIINEAAAEVAKEMREEPQKFMPRVEEPEVAQPQTKPTQVDLSSLSDEELQKIWDSLPKHPNGSVIKSKESDAIHQEMMKRYKAEVAKYNAEAEKETGLKHGDRVVKTVVNAFGTGTEEFTGKVVYDKNGRLSVKTDKPDGSGRKMFPIDKGWKKVTEAPVAQEIKPISAKEPAAEFTVGQKVNTRNWGEVEITEVNIGAKGKGTVKVKLPNGNEATVGVGALKKLIAIEKGIRTTVKEAEKPPIEKAEATGIDIRRMAGKKAEKNTFYRATIPGRTERIKTGNEFWDSLLFVADNIESARPYGTYIEKYVALPDAKILYEGTAEFVKVAGRQKKGESLLDFVARAAQRAKDAGYDAVWFKRQSDVGTAIINRDMFKNVGPIEKPIPPEAKLAQDIRKMAAEEVQPKPEPNINKGYLPTRMDEIKLLEQVINEYPKSSDSAIIKETPEEVLPDDRTADNRVSDTGIDLRSDNEGEFTGEGTEGTEEATFEPVPEQERTTGEEITEQARYDKAIINARPNIKTPPVKNLVKEYPVLNGRLMTHQIEGVNAALAALENMGGFLLADGAGAGKTAQGLAVAYIKQQQGKKKILILTERDAVIKDAWLKECERMFGNSVELKQWKGTMDEDGIYVATYSKLRTSNPIPPEGWDVVIFDESHNLKNWKTGSQQAAVGLKMIESTGEVMFLSATPFDRLQEYYYLGLKLGTFKDKYEFEQWLSRNGIEKRRREIPKKSGFPAYVTEYVAKVPIRTILLNMRRFGDRLTAEGVMLKREVSMDGLELIVKEIELPSEAHMALNHIKRQYPSKKKALAFMAMRRHLENYKIDAAVELAKEELAKGRQVAIFAGYKEEAETGGITSDSIIKHLKEKLEAVVGEGNVAEIHGGIRGQAKPNIQKEIAAYQDGEKKVAIATMDMGSTGISLHDEKGIAPRTQIMLTLPWSALKQVQAAGRSHRLTSKSSTVVYMLSTDTEVDQRLAEILAGKMNLLGAIVKGDLQKLNIQRGQDMADVGEGMVEDLITDEDEAEARAETVVSTENITGTVLEKEVRKMTESSITVSDEGNLVIGDGYSEVKGKFGDEPRPGTIRIQVSKNDELGKKYVVILSAFKDKDVVKGLGARWGPTIGGAKNWYLPIVRIPEAFTKFKHGEITARAIKLYEETEGEILKRLDTETDEDVLAITKSRVKEVNRILTRKGIETDSDVVFALAGKKKPRKKPTTTPKEAVEEVKLKSVDEIMNRVQRISPKAARQMSEIFAKALKTVLRAGRLEKRILRKGAVGSFSKKALTGRIKKQKVESWRVAGHELGHGFQFITGFKPDKSEMTALAHAFYPGDIPKSKAVAEGFAEFMVLWFADNEAARQRAPKTAEMLDAFLDNNPELGEAIAEMQAIAAHDLEGSALAQMANLIAKPGEKGKKNIGVEYEVPLHLKPIFEAVDASIPLEAVYRAAREKGFNGLNPAQLFAISGSANERAKTLFKATPRDFSGRFLLSPERRTLQQIAEEAANYIPKADKEVFEKMGLADKKGRPVGGLVLMDYIYHAMRYLERYEVMEKTGRHFELPMTKEYFQEAVQEAKEHFPEMVRLVQEYSETLSETILRLLVSEEVISEATADRVRQGSKYYLPLYYVSKSKPTSGSEFARRGAGQVVKMFQGSEEQSKNFLEATMLKLYDTALAVEINRVMNTLEENLRQKEMGFFGEIVDAPVVQRIIREEDLARQLDDFLSGEMDADDDTRVIKLFMPGGLGDISKSEPILMARHGDRKVYMRVSPDIYKAVLSMKPITVNWVVRVLGALSTAFRFGALTTLRYVTNALVRDVVQSKIQTKQPTRLGRPVLVNLLKGAAKAAGLDPKLMDLYIQSGGYGSSPQEVINNLIKASASDGLFNTSAPGWKRTAHNVFVRVVNAPGELLRVLEEMPRVMEFEDVLKDLLKKLGMTLDDLKEGRVPDEIAKEVEKALVEAAYASREIIANFGLHGANEGFRKYVRTVTFMQGSIQGIYRFARQVKDAPGQTFLRSAIYILPLTLIAWALSHDDDKYRDMPSEARDRYWWFPVGSGDTPFYIALAKPYDYAFPANMLERFLDWALTNDPNSRKPLSDLRVAIKSSFGTPYMPMLLDTIMSIYMNRDAFGSPIIPQREQDVDPTLQYGPGTTTAAIKLSELVSMVVGDKAPSPRMIDYFMKNSFGTLSRVPWSVLNFMVGGTFFDEREGLEYAPIIGSLIYGRAESGSRITDRFYEDYNKAQEKYNSAREWAKQDIDLKTKLTDKDVRLILSLPARRAIANELAELRKAVRETTLRKDITPEQKAMLNARSNYMIKVASGVLYSMPLPAVPEETGFTEAQAEAIQAYYISVANKAITNALKKPGGAL